VDLHAKIKQLADTIYKARNERFAISSRAAGCSRRRPAARSST
jgi:hypothetical protein